MTQAAVEGKDAQVTNCIRCLAVDSVQKAKSGHPGAPMGMAPVAYLLWAEAMKYDSKCPEWWDRDRFVLSNGHACALLYSMLHLTGYDLPLDELQKFRQFGSRTPGHPERGVTAGVEVTTGPLGQGVANGVGLAIAEAHLAATYNRPDLTIVDHFTYVFCGDGCLMEGVTQEALSLAGHLGLEKLVVVYDDNRITIDGSTELSFTEKSKEKYEALGFHIIAVPNGDTDFAAIRAALSEAKQVKGKPKMIVLTTTIGYGSALQGTHSVHGAPLGDEEIVKVKTKFGRDPSKKFFVEQEVYDVFQSHVQKCQTAHQQWRATLEKYRKTFPAEAAQFEAQMSGKLPDGWMSKLPLNDKSIATRKASENVLAALIPTIPALFGGSADLTPSNLTRPSSAEMKDFLSSAPAGSYLRFGVREHGMCAIMNGIDAHGGFIPFGGTFLNFIGYAMGAVRLAALSHHRVIYVATHDSIGLGEDGPTHQPIELVALLRATPNLLVFRPCDQTETSGAWAAAIQNSKRPSVICLSRQNTVPQSAATVEAVQRGAYHIVRVEQPDLVIVATGSEVSLAVEASKAMTDLKVSVASMPCQELFAEQPAEYQASVFPDGSPVLSIEPYASFGWDRYSHYQLSLDHFGASGPADTLYKEFGFTTEKVVEIGRKLADYFKGGKAPSKRFGTHL